MKRKTNVDIILGEQHKSEETKAIKRQKTKEYDHNRYISNQIEKIESSKNNNNKNLANKTPEQKEIDKASRRIENLSKEKIAAKSNYNNTYYNKNTKAAKTSLNSTESSLSLQWDYKNICEL